MIITLNNREEWLNERKKGIGGSDAAALLGKHPSLTNVDLFEIKTGLKEQKDISNLDCVQYGIAAEPLMREMFKLDFPQYEVLYNEWEIHIHPVYDFLRASLDGRLIEKSTGIEGGFEAKTTEIRSSQDWYKWDKRVPDNYYIQILHYFAVREELKFFILKARIKYFKDDMPAFTERHYLFNRVDRINDINLVKNTDIAFWQNHIITGKRPDLLLPEI